MDLLIPTCVRVCAVRAGREKNKIKKESARANSGVSSNVGIATVARRYFALLTTPTATVGRRFEDEIRDAFGMKIFIPARNCAVRVRSARASNWGLVYFGCLWAGYCFL